MAVVHFYPVNPLSEGRGFDSCAITSANDQTYNHIFYLYFQSVQQED